MYTVIASIRLRTEAEGGMPKEGFSGMRPSFRVAGELIMCEVIKDPEGGTLERGKTYDVRIKLPYGEVFREHLYVGFRFELNVGGMVIGEGVIKEIPEQKGS